MPPASGAQTIRLIFDQPQKLKRISLVFEESETERTQEFVLRWSQMAGARFEKSCASSGISAHPTPHVRSRNITFYSRMSPFLNWSSCLTSVEERLAPRSRVCACLDSCDSFCSQFGCELQQIITTAYGTPPPQLSALPYRDRCITLISPPSRTSCIMFACVRMVFSTPESIRSSVTLHHVSARTSCDCFS